MQLIPEPVKLVTKAGFFNITPGTEICLGVGCEFKDLEGARLLQEEIKKKTGFKPKINKSFCDKGHNTIYLAKKEFKKNISTSTRGKTIEQKKSEDRKKTESYRLEVSPENITIKGNDTAGLFYGIQTLRQLIKLNGLAIPCMKIEDSPFFAYRGFYHDISRGKVPTLDTLKEIADKAAFYKLNQIQLYVEHTFAFEGFSEVWSETDPLTAEEILLFDEYCHKQQIELVPSLSTFGHLYHLLSSHSFQHLSELENSTEKPFSWVDRMMHHTLDVSNPESIKVVEEMLRQFIPLFSSDKFNICGDETFDLGEGKNKALAEKVGKGRLYVDFLNKIISVVKKYNKQVMFWGDIILKYPELMDGLPGDIICLNWDYSPDPDEDKTRIIANSKFEQYVCPGVSGWNRVMNDLDVAFSNIRKMVAYGRKYGAIGVLNTDWGDLGHINLLANSWPGMIYGASLSWNPVGGGEITSIDKKISRLEFGDKSGEITGLLRELARQQAVDWGLVAIWKEEKCGQSSVFSDENYREKISGLEAGVVIKKYNRAGEIAERLLKLGTSIPEEKHGDLREFYVSACGVRLLNSLALIIKKYDMGQDKVELIHKPHELAILLEYWLRDYTECWRRRNKESELYRIRDAVMAINDCLRRFRQMN
jgi:hypothetical protein